MKFKAVLFSQNVEINQKPIGGQMKKKNVISTYKEWNIIQLQKGKDWYILQYDGWIRYAKWKKPDTEDHIPYNAICKKFLEQVNP